jgi:hypothetical protein
MFHKPKQSFTKKLFTNQQTASYLEGAALPPVKAPARHGPKKAVTDMRASIYLRCLIVAAVSAPLSLPAQNAPSNSFTTHSKPVPAVLKPSHELFSPEMCKVKQPVASRAYIAYCMRVAPNDQPVCPANSQNEVLGATSTGFISYFEPLDCSYHVGEDPRQQHIARAAASAP